MAHQAEARAVQIVQNLGDVAPLGDGRFGLVVVVQRADDDVADLSAHADCNARKLGHGTDIVVFKLTARAAVGAVQRADRLKRDEDHRRGELADDRRKDRGGCVGEHIAHHDVRPVALHSGKRVIRLGVGVDHAVVNDFHVVFRKQLLKILVILHERLIQTGELRPVDGMRHTKYADAPDARFFSFQHNLTSKSLES